MKKTLAALIIGAFAASAANAAVVYDNDGTKVDFNGSLRLIMEKSNSEGAGHTHSGLRNAGSRVALKVTHDLDDGYYALGRFELRFNGKNDTIKQDSFGDVYVKRAYAGFGHKEYGEITFGRQVTIADDLSTANDYEYGIISKDDYIPTAGNSVIRYDYKGVKDLQIGVSYQFADNRTSSSEASSSWAIQDDPNDPDSYVVKKVDTPAVDGNEVAVGAIQNNYQLGIIYNGKWDDVNGVIAKFGYGRTNYKSATNKKHHKDGFLASLGYNHNEFIVSVDGGYAKEKLAGESLNRYFVSPGFQAPITDKSNFYGNYLYEVTQTGKTAAGTEKDKKHGFLLGVDYQFHKQVVVFLEGKYQVTKSYAANGSYVDDSKVKDKAIGVGMRVFW